MLQSFQQQLSCLPLNTESRQPAVSHPLNTRGQSRQLITIEPHKNKWEKENKIRATNRSEHNTRIDPNPNQASPPLGIAHARSNSPRRRLRGRPDPPHQASQMAAASTAVRMLPDGGADDEERWLAEGIAGVQQNAFYMHRALVSPRGTLTPHVLPIPASSVWPQPCNLGAGLEQPQGRAQVLGSDALRAAHLAALTSQVLRAL
jgi:hypothetical protein